MWYIGIKYVIKEKVPLLQLTPVPCPFGYGMCWQIDELLTLYAFDLRNTEGIHEPLLSERYRSVSSKPTNFDFITNHFITHGEANHRDGWATLYLHKHATLWMYPVKRHHLQPKQRWIARRMIEAVIHLHAHTGTYTGMHASSRSCMQMDGIHRVGLQCVCIWMQLHAAALHVDADASICMQSQSG